MDRLRQEVVPPGDGLAKEHSAALPRHVLEMIEIGEHACSACLGPVTIVAVESPDVCRVQDRGGCTIVGLPLLELLPLRFRCFDECSEVLVSNALPVRRVPFPRPNLHGLGDTLGPVSLKMYLNNLIAPVVDIEFACLQFLRHLDQSLQVAPGVAAQGSVTPRARSLIPLIRRDGFSKVSFRASLDSMIRSAFSC